MRREEGVCGRVGRDRMTGKGCGTNRALIEMWEREKSGWKIVRNVGSVAGGGSASGSGYAD